MVIYLIRIKPEIEGIPPIPRYNHVAAYYEDDNAIIMK